ncbi:uncharacterized protein [Leuresthes tenuis]|uniref:uncharacterized protein n=1 Tax=Leuresthes tenuis TaxID=355514 RepID=UPI003B50DE1A
MEILGERRTRNIWTFLGLLMVLTVSGDDRVPVKSFQNGSALLSCPCMGIDLEEGVKWQNMERKELVFRFNKTRLHIGDNYTGRVETFLSKNGHDCSLLLTNITVADRGKYRCIFFIEKLYTFHDVTLHVCGTYDISQRVNIPSNGTNVFSCHVKECNKEVEIQWVSKESPLTNSTQTTIYSSDSLDTHTGLYNFTSNLTVKDDSTLDPKCEVKSKKSDMPTSGKYLFYI